MEEKNHRLTFTTQELILIHTVMYNSTVKGEVVVKFGSAMGKIEEALRKAQKEIEAEKIKNVEIPKKDGDKK